MSARTFSLVLVGTLILATFASAAVPVRDLPVPTLAPNIPGPIAALTKGMPAAWQDLLQANEFNLLGAVQAHAALPAPVLPSEGMRAIMTLSGGDPASLDPAALAQYDALPAVDRDALGTLLAAYLEDARLSRLAFAVPITQEQFDAAVGSDPLAPLPPVDFALLLQGQRVMAAAAQAAVPVFVRDVEVFASLPAMVACPGVDIDFTERSSVHACDVRFALDAKGDDIYLNNAGGVGQTIPVSGNNAVGAAAFALDLDGNDQYLGHIEQGGLTGGALGGSGMLIEVAGDDVYRVSTDHAGGTNGGGEVGAGFMLDLAGNDDVFGENGIVSAFHNEGGGANGGAVAGSGLFVDVAGNDKHDGVIGGSGGVNGATHGGAGTAIDYAGDDTWTGYNNNLGAVNGAAFAGSGLLIDAGGNDYFNGVQETLGAVNGGAFYGSGMLLEGVGDTVYTGFNGMDGGVNGGAFVGSGLLVDQGGDDSYSGYNGGDGGVNGGDFMPQGVGQVFDLGGDDHFTGWLGGSGGINGGSFFGFAELVNVGGVDVYDTQVGAGQTRGINGGTFFGGGMLLDYGGTGDAYRDVPGGAWSYDQTVVGGAKGTAGDQFDCPDYVAGEGNLLGELAGGWMPCHAAHVG